MTVLFLEIVPFSFYLLRILAILVTQPTSGPVFPFAIYGLGRRIHSFFQVLSDFLQSPSELRERILAPTPIEKLDFPSVPKTNRQKVMCPVYIHCDAKKPIEHNCLGNDSWYTFLYVLTFKWFTTITILISHIFEHYIITTVIQALPLNFSLTTCIWGLIMIQGVVWVNSDSCLFFLS